MPGNRPAAEGRCGVAIALCGHVARMALCALVAAAALGHVPPLLAQEPGVPSPAQNLERIDALSERVEELEGEGEPVTEARLSVPYVVLTAVVGTQLAYLTVQMFRNRERPVLSWTVIDGGDGFELRDMPDGSKRIAVRITNVGQAAAVDIVWHAGTRASARATRNVPLGASPNFVGSLYPSASAQVLIAVSSAEHARVMDGEMVSFSLVLRYKSMGNRRYTHRVFGSYSKDSRNLAGTVSKSLPV